MAAVNPHVWDGQIFHTVPWCFSGTSVVLSRKPEGVIWAYGSGAVSSTPPPLHHNRRRPCLMPARTLAYCLSWAEGRKAGRDRVMGADWALFWLMTTCQYLRQHACLFEDLRTVSVDHQVVTIWCQCGSYKDTCKSAYWMDNLFVFMSSFWARYPSQWIRAMLFPHRLDVVCALDQLIGLLMFCTQFSGGMTHWRGLWYAKDGEKWWEREM